MTEIIDLVYGLRIEVPWWAWVAVVVMVFGGLLLPDHGDGEDAIAHVRRADE